MEFATHTLERNSGHILFFASKNCATFLKPSGQRGLTIYCHLQRGEPEPKLIPVYRFPWGSREKGLAYYSGVRDLAIPRPEK